MIEACGPAAYAQATALGLRPRRSAVSESRDVTEGEPTDDDLQNPAHWRSRAEETRQKANAMSSPELRECMLQIALDYDRLAERAERAIAKSRDQTNG
jgi:hypothetical protein